MPVGTAEKHLRKSIIHELALQLGKNQCCRCSLAVEDPDDLAIVHVQEWEGDPDLFWALTNIAFSHADCEAARSGKRQRESKKMNKVEVRVVLTVDGRNVITGKPGDHNDGGQVIGPRDTWLFKGWRTSNSQVAAFEFGNKSGSYSAQLGSSQNVGVIGCAVFEEERPEPITRTVKETTYIPYPVPTPAIFTPPNPWGAQWSTTISTSSPGIAPMSDMTIGSPVDSSVQVSSSTTGQFSGGSGGSPGVTLTSSNAVHTGEPASVKVRQASATVDSRPSRKRGRGRGRGEPKVQQRLGTGFGEALNSQVRTVTFNRATDEPCELWVIRYDSMRSLQERGIMVRPSEKRQEAPQAFPENEGYCQSPGGVRRRRGRRYGSR